MRYLYKITNKINGKCYIGQTVDFKRRMWAHRTGKDKKTATYLAIKKYGEKNFDFAVLAECSDDMIDGMERAAIKNFNSIIPNGYNLESGGCANKKQHPETIKKISDAQRGKKFSEERLANRIKYWKEHSVSEETKKKQSRSRKGKKRQPCSKETKIKISLAKKGKPGKPHTEEAKRKISGTQKGRKYSKERVMKATLARSGYKHTTESKRNISLALKAFRDSRAEAVGQLKLF